MQRLVLQKRGKGNEVSVLNVSATGLSLCTEQRVDFVWEMGDWELTLIAVSFTQQISSLVLICDAKTWSLKKEKGNEVSVLNVLATGLSLCADQGVDSAQEMGGLELTLNRVSFTQQISSLVSICDAKTWSHKKEEKEKQWVCWLFWPLDCLYALNRGRLCTRDGWLRTDPQQGQFHPTNLFLGLNLWCKDLSYKKEEKETKWVCWMFRPLDCLYALNRGWTLYERWVTESWLLLLSVSPNKSLL